MSGERRPVIFGVAGLSLSAEERAFFQELRPAGYILFARNCADPDQIKSLTQDLRTLNNHPQTPILIDQEGGRVARLRPPHWQAHPPAAQFGTLFATDPDAAREALRLTMSAIAAELSDLGINVDCLPVLDVRHRDADPVIGDRAYSHNATIVAELGRFAHGVLLDHGILPVIKHIPGHGRATLDSHKALPVLDTTLSELRRVDFLPFKALSDAPLAMTAHVVYDAIDPENCATFSRLVISQIIRDEIGFNGLLMSDDLSMGALEGPMGERAHRAFKAGCDLLLHCNGQMKEMREIARDLPYMPEVTAARLDGAMTARLDSAPLPPLAQLIERRDALLAKG